ncbi:hypothetical protein [Morganella morganii]|uniref:hypothetical protein n=1 Tax=Morganella morganii TaxID=582 RepID=UPI001BDAD072|nr:hypothetical protein [Morganella morganii]EKT0591617.1 hypothetical protein [Morganella morganii]ELF0883961.1 hypothetical protein [Morganella morganii]MBT0519644.1 hypothetical protein [Morganella morganii subsp. morganii]QWL88043.1 hypothetical protein IZ187_10565 [Morganella morganii subsp. morganii]HCR3194566.1 hypothetical protein [Morganella morganii]
MTRLIAHGAVFLLLTGSFSALSAVPSAAQQPQCEAANTLTRQNNRMIWQVPAFSGPVKSVRSESVPDPASPRSEKISSKADFSPCGEMTHFETRKRDMTGRMIVTSTLSGSETRNIDSYVFRVYRHLPGKKARFPMTVSTAFTKDAQQQVTGGKGKMYIEGNETAINGTVQIQRKDGKLTMFTLTWPDIYLTLSYKVGYDDAGRVSSLTSAQPDGSGESVTYYTYTPEGYPATKEVTNNKTPSGVRTLTMCLSRDHHGNCVQERIVRMPSEKNKKNAVPEQYEMTIVNNIIEYYQ